MINDSELICLNESRRDKVRAASFFGLDYLEVKDGQQTLEVRFLGKAPKQIAKENIAISGGRRIRDIRVKGLRVIRQEDSTLDDIMEVRVDKAGDLSVYTLKVVKLDENGRPTDQPMDSFDPRYAVVDFSFKAGCPSDLDCKPQQVCPPTQFRQPEINYLAKDYSSFRQLILDRLALIMPDWQERHAPDLGITLVELLAYAGDYLSYYQDSVATEAYLGTARQRISVRRHARLVDYAMHEGCNARAWISLWTDQDHHFDDPKQIFFITPFPGAPATPILQAETLVNVLADSYEVFEPLVEDPKLGIQIYAEHSEIYFYTWGDSQWCLPKGAVSATLVDGWKKGTDVPAGSRKLKLKVGDVLIFEEVLGPKTGNTADADPKHRQAVRLTKVEPMIDPLYQATDTDLAQALLDIEWCQEDALAFSMCVSVKGPAPDCILLKNVSVARGNVILADSGSSAKESLGIVPTLSSTQRCPTDCEPPESMILPAKFNPKLKNQPLTFSQPLPACACVGELISQDPRLALPWIKLTAIPPAPAASADGTVKPLFTFKDLTNPFSLAGSLRQPADVSAQYLRGQLSSAIQKLLDAWNGSAPLPTELENSLVGGLNGILETWTPRRDLLESGSDDRDFVVEMDNDGYAHLRFGDGKLGRVPDAGSAFRTEYRVGNGSAGNVGPEAIQYLVLREGVLSGINIKPHNPLSAKGGAEPEPLAEVKMFAPYDFRKTLERAVTAEDYAALAADNDRRLKERSSLAAADQGGPSYFTPFKRLQGAKATLRWTGSWYEALVAVDPIGTEEADPDLLQEVTAYLEPYRRIGQDLEVKPAIYVPLDLVLTVCVLPNYLRGHVEAVLLDAFSNSVLPDGSLGFFHPDKLTFGEGIYPSRIVAIAQAIVGVQNVKITRLERYEIGEPSPGTEMADEELPEHGLLPLGPLEIARLDNDPNFPENGRLLLDMRGGR